jgi:hypothetical protein
MELLAQPIHPFLWNTSEVAILWAEELRNNIEHPPPFIIIQKPSLSRILCEVKIIFCIYGAPFCELLIGTLAIVRPQPDGFTQGTVSPYPKSHPSLV